jgi:protein Mpv17
MTSLLIFHRTFAAVAVHHNGSIVRTRFSRATLPLRNSIADNSLASTAAASKSRTGSSTNRSTTILGNVWATYCTALEKQPLLTKASMASVIFFSSDSVTQYLLRKDENAFEWDTMRAMSAGNFGVVGTTFLHFWWGFLEKLVGARIPLAQHRIANTAAKVIIHQSMGAPFYIYSYYVLTNFGQRVHKAAGWDDVVQAWTDVHEKAGAMLWPTMLRHWSVWPVVQSFNFYFTPLHHRVLVHNTVLILWSGYLSYLNHEANHIMTPGKEIKMEIARQEKLQRKEEETKKLDDTKTVTASPLESKLVNASTKVLEAANAPYR